MIWLLLSAVITYSFLGFGWYAATRAEHTEPTTAGLDVNEPVAARAVAGHSTACAQPDLGGGVRTRSTGEERSRVTITGPRADVRAVAVPIVAGLRAAGFFSTRRNDHVLVQTSPTATVWLSFTETGDVDKPDALVVDAWGMSAEQIVELYVISSLDSGHGLSANVRVNGSLADIEVLVAA